MNPKTRSPVGGYVGLRDAFLCVANFMKDLDELSPVPFEKEVVKQPQD